MLSSTVVGTIDHCQMPLNSTQSLYQESRQRSVYCGCPCHQHQNKQHNEHQKELLHFHLQRLVCPIVSDQRDNENVDENYNARYPCQVGIINDRLACGSNPQRTQSNLYQQVNLVIDYDRDTLVKPLNINPATAITLTVLTTATLSHFPTRIPYHISSGQTLAPPALSTAGAVESVVGSVTGTSSTISVLNSIAASFMARASSFNTARLLEPDLVLAISIGLSVPCLALVFVLLGVLTWREWEIRRAEERLVKEYPDLNAEPPFQWQELPSSITTAEKENQLLLDLRIQQELERIRRNLGRRYDRERVPKVSQFVESSNI